MKEFGFTLSETLITIAIIGVVAALTIPNLITTVEKHQTVTRLQKAISVLNQAYRLSFEDYGEPDDVTNISGAEYFEKHWKPYLKVAIYCDAESLCGYKTSFPWTYPNGINTGVSILYEDFGQSILTPDNIFYNIRVKANGTTRKRSKLVITDINGIKGPNVNGRDVFFLERDEITGSIKPFGNEKSDEYIKSNCTSSCCQLTSTCAEMIRRNSWNIPEGYPWKF